jgi:hypothetical protein
MENKSFIVENTRERERLYALVNRITDEELTCTLYEEGWTIAVALAHLAFWDTRRIILLKRWKKEGVAPSPSDDDVLNDTLLPFFIKLDPREAARLAALSAITLDRELERLSPEMITAIEKLGDRHALNRAIHRKMHLDDIEALLQPKETGYRE